MASPFNPCHLPGFFPPQQQVRQPGIEYIMSPRPISEPPLGCYKNNMKLLNKVAVITGGDSGIRRAAAYAFAKEGADVAVIYLNEHVDARETKNRIMQLGRRCLLIAADVTVETKYQSITL